MVLIVFCVVSLLFNHWLCSSDFPQIFLKTTICELLQLGFYAKLLIPTCCLEQLCSFLCKSGDKLLPFFFLHEIMLIFLTARNIMMFVFENDVIYFYELWQNCENSSSKGTAFGTAFFCLQKQITTSLCHQEQTALGLPLLFLLQV